MSVHTWAAVAAGVAVSASAHASFITVDDIGGPVNMFAAPLSDLLEPGSMTLTEGEMADLHSLLNSSGVETDGYVTFLLAETDAGLSFITLIDKNTLIAQPEGGVDPAPDDNSLVMSTTGPIDLEYFANTEAGDQTNWLDAQNGLQVFDGLYNWNGASEGDGFAWGGLDDGDAVSFHFTDLGTPALSAWEFQFVSYTGNDWDVVAMDDFSSNDQFVFSFTTVIPGPGAVALLGAAGLTGRRRRRRSA